jgi:hypothetical protein
MESTTIINTISMACLKYPVEKVCQLIDRPTARLTPGEVARINRAPVSGTIRAARASVRDWVLKCSVSGLKCSAQPHLSANHSNQPVAC